MTEATPVIDKIQKLFALSKGTHSKDEAYSALTKAQTLMAQYGISQEDLDKRADELPDNLKPQTVKTTEFSKTYPWYWSFAKVIAANTRCYYWRNKGNWGKNQHIAFLGTFTDAAIAARSWEFIVAESKTGWQTYWKRIKYAANYAKQPISLHRDSYYSGYTEGLEVAYAENVVERGLMIVKPNSVIQHHKKMHFATASIRGMNNSHTASHSVGFNDGKNSIKRRSIGQ